MELLLPFQVSPSTAKISFAEKIFFIGSCFTEEIGNMMKSAKFTVLQNPNGILYDPLSIASALNSYIKNRKYYQDDLFYQNELWHSWQHHSLFSGLSKEEVLQGINQSQSGAHDFLKEASWLIITTGTAYSYSLVENNEAVANCHKAPSSFFQKKLLAIDLIVSELSAAISNLRQFNPGLKIILTVSPVRHVRDGVVENNRSKARLIDALHSLEDKFENVFYFPAYELIIDVLRDYRFYKEDLVHPTETATRYVFEEFCKAFIDGPGNKLLFEIQSIITAMKHRPFHEDSASHKKFKRVQLEKIKTIVANFPAIDFSNEEKFFSE